MKLYPPCIWIRVLYAASQLSRVIMVSNVIVVYIMFIGIVQIWTKTSTQTDNPPHPTGHVLHVMNSIFPSIIYWMIMHSYLHYLQMPKTSPTWIYYPDLYLYLFNSVMNPCTCLVMNPIQILISSINGSYNCAVNSNYYLEDNFNQSISYMNVVKQDYFSFFIWTSEVSEPIWIKC